jgi:hypothetical protein
MQGPWSGQHAAYFIDADYNKFTWLSPLSTIGSAVAVTEVVDQVRLVRKFRGLVFAEVELGHKDWPTGPAGLKQRPCLLNDIRWIKLKNDQTTTLPAPDVTPSIASGAPADATPVEAPTRQEEMDDKIPW